MRSVTDFVFPVFGGIVEDHGALRTLKTTEVSGTAFSVGEGWFVTAGHVVKSAASLGQVAIARLAPHGVWEFATADAVRFADHIDVAFFRAPLANVKEHTWHGSALPMFSDVSAVGYPYGKDPERPHIDARGFKGAVVTATQFARLAGAPDIYELSFSAPRGLSGAPVMAADRVVGIIIGNRSTEMLVFSHREMVTEEREFVTERFEAMQLGIAIRSTELLKCTVPGMPRESLAAHLEAQGLLSLALGE